MARLIFMGTPEIAVPSLRALVQAGHEIASVVTQPDRPKGRGQRSGAPPIKIAAQEMRLPTYQPAKVREPEFLEQLKAYSPDGIVVVAYGRILPKEVIEASPWGCINLHFSLLPKYRGASCVAHALINGEEETGVTTMLIDEGLDTGPILMQWTEPIAPDDTAETLAARLAELGAQQLVKTCEGLQAGNLHPVPQQEEASSYAPLLKKEQGHVDWTLPAQKVYNLYRGLTPWPGIYGFLGELRILFTEVRPRPDLTAGEPGALEVGAAGELRVHCGAGRLEILKLKPAGKRILSAPEFVRGLQQKNNLSFK